MKKFGNVLMIGLAFLVSLNSCVENDIPVVVFEEDFFCGEGKPEVYFRFEVDRGDVFVPEGTEADLDMCSLSNEISSQHNIESIINNDFIISGTKIKIDSRGYIIDLDLIGTLFRNELNFESERSFGKAILNNDFEFRTVSGSDQFDDGNLGFDIPAIRPSLAALEIIVRTDNQNIRYKSDAPVVSEEYPYYLENAQTGSFIQIDETEEIDYVNPDFPEVKYNYVITGTFQCRLYREGSPDRFLDLKQGSFRLPVYFRKTEEVF